MQSLAVLSSFICLASAQFAAWPATSYNPYYQSVLGPLRTPVNAVSVIGQGVAPGVIPAPAPIAAPAYAFPAPVPAPLPLYRAPVAPAPAPLAAPYFAPRPIVAVPEVIPRVPAYLPFATSPVFIGSSKAKKTA